MIEENIFPRWEHNIPTLGTKHSHAGNKTTLRLVVTLLLMMVVGVCGVKAQTWADGLYYLKSYDAGWYLWPSVVTNSESGNRYLTTYNGKSASAVANKWDAYNETWSMWVVQNVTVGENHYIQLISPKLNAYVVIYDKTAVSTSYTSKPAYGDRDVWLSTTLPDDVTRTYFWVNTNQQTTSGGLTYYRISPTQGYNDTNAEDYANRSFNSAAGNKSGLGSGGSGTDLTDQRGGLIQLYNGDPKWTVETATMAAPTISDVDENSNTFTITDNNSLPTGYEIRYTIDGTDPSPTNGTVCSGPVTVEGTWTVKAAVVRYGIVLTEVATKNVILVTQCAMPTFTYNHDAKTVTISPVYPADADIYYTTNGVDPTTTESDTNFKYTSGNTISTDGCDVIKAIAHKDGKDDSPIASITRVSTPTFGFNDTAQSFTIASATEGATIYYTTDGSDPTTSSTEYSGAVAISGETTVKAIAVKEGYIYSTIAENTYTKTAAPTITFDQYTNTFTLASATDGATIHYTTDGTEPTTASASYNEAVSLTSAATIKAIAVKTGTVNSTITSKEIGKSSTPVIAYSGDDEITITADPAIAEIYYTTSSTAPTKESGTLYSSAFTLSATEDIVRAVVYEADKVSSDVATLNVVVHMGNSYPYLIRNRNNRWTINGENRGVYYMIPGDDDGSGNTTVNTSSLLRPTMEWLFKYAATENGTVYYYIVNASTGVYLYYDSSAASGSQIVVKASGSFSSGDDGYKFSLPSYSIGGTLVGYDIQPYSLTSDKRFLHKGDGNGSNSRVTLSDNAGTDNSVWTFVKKSNLDTALPFNVTDGNGATFYKLSTNATATAYVVPAAAVDGYVITSTATSANQDATYQNWYFEKAADPTGSDWLTYYHIRNAITGEYLYFNGTAANNNNAFVMHSSIGSEADRYQFAVARAWVENRWFIVPKTIKDTQLNNISTMWRDGNNALKTQATRNNGNAIWQFTESEMTLAPPVITYDAANNKVIITCSTPGVTIRYNTGASSAEDPTSTTGTEYPEGGFTLDNNINVIKAIAVKDNNTSSTTTYTVIVHTSTASGMERPYLVQSVECTDFYMIPGDQATISDVSYNVMNTTSLARPSIAWCFVNAGITGNVQYYYIVNKSTGDYVCYNGSVVCRHSSSTFADAADKSIYRFRLEENTDGSYHIKPYGNANGLSKSNGNNSADRMVLHAASNVYSHWNFIAIFDNKLTDTATDAFTPVTDGGEVKYYKIGNAAQTAYFVIPPTGTTGNAQYASTSNAATGNIDNWYFKEAGSDDWLSYYYIVNAISGEYLYYQGATSTETQTLAFVTKPLGADGTAANNYKFVIAKTTTANTYYIVPEPLKYLSNNNYCLLWRDNGQPLKTNLQRADSNRKWTFTEVAAFCLDPIITEDSEGNIIITCDTPESEIRYTIDGSEPSVSSLVYGNDKTTTSKICIKAFAKLKLDNTGTSKSTTYTLLNCPDIDLATTSYVYDKTAKEPAVTKVYIGDVVATEGTYSAPVYTNNTNAGTEIVKPTVTITDAVADDRLVIANAKKEFVIQPLEVTLNWANTTLTYNRSAQTPTATVTNCIEGDECNVTVAVEGETSHTDVGDYTAIAQSLDNTNYALPMENTMAFSIIRKSIGDGTSLAAGFIVTMGDGDNPTFTVKDGTEELIKDTEYEVSDPVTEDGNQVWTISGKGNYTGSTKLMRISLTFNETGEAAGQQVHDVTPYQASADMTISGLHSYIVTHINMTKRTLTIQEINYVPKDEPVLLLTDLTGETTNFTATPLHVAEGDKADTSGNLLQVSPEGGKAVGFGEVYMYYQGKFVMTTEGTLPEGKFYLDNPNPPSSSSGGGGTSNAPLRIVIDDTTGIELIDNGQLIIDNGVGEWYTLDGQKLSKHPTRKGLYIQNGKKVVIK